MLFLTGNRFLLLGMLFQYPTAYWWRMGDGKTLID
jgi:hypothetical protein